MATVIEKFGIRVRVLRDELGMTAAALASVTKQSVTTINQVEQGRVPPGFASMVKLCAALRTDPVYLFVFPEDNPRDALVELTRGASRATVRAMYRACQDIAEQAAGRNKAVGE